MKIKVFILSFCGFCIFYICNADWIDDLIEDYLGKDYEEVAPFISSVTAGTEEFDRLVEELSSKTRYKWLPSSFVAFTLLGVLLLSVLVYEYAFLLREKNIVKAGARLLNQFYHIRNSTDINKEEIQNLVSEFLEKKLNNLCGNKNDDVPVKLLWKGGTLIESTIHCNLRNDTKFSQVIPHSKMSLGSPRKGNKRLELSPSGSGDLTVQKIVNIRKLLESEQEIIHNFKCDKLKATVDDEAPLRIQKTDHKPEIPEESNGRGPSTETVRALTPSSTDKHSAYDMEHPRDNVGDASTEILKYSQNAKLNLEEKTLEEEFPDPKLMNRIRLLESRLRLEELKNKNWIDRMSRAEEILQQLNKQINLDRLTEESIPYRKKLTQAYPQVERIEVTRPIETLTETLKITSTVTNYPPSSHPRRNMQFTLVNQYPAYYLQAPCTSLSEVIKKEVGFPSSGDFKKTCHQLPPAPQIPALPGPSILPQSSILSKFFYR